MASYPGEKTIIAQAARRNRIPPELLWGLYGAETNFGENKNRSSAGAQGPFQFMPGTARSYGIDPHNFKQAANAAAKYLATYKDRGTAGMLAAYNAGPAGNPRNPETAAYIPKVQQLAKTWDGPSGGSGGGSGGSGGSSGSVSVSGPTVSGSDQGSAGVAALLQAAMAPQAAPQASAPLAPPAHSAAATTPQAYQQAPSGGGGPAPAKSIDALLQAVSAIPQSDTTVNPGEVTSDGRSAGDVVSSMGAPSGGSGKFKITGPNPSRIQPQVRNFVQRVAGVHGKTIVGSDGTGHSKHTTSGSVSEHYTGSATDIPAAGAELTRMGQAALVAAGWSPTRARKAKGGIYNVVSGGKRHQIIFNTREGGNHWDHLHVGVSGRR